MDTDHNILHRIEPDRLTDSRITSVTVYLDGAVIKRRFELELEAGVSQVHIRMEIGQTQRLRIEKQRDVHLSNVTLLHSPHNAVTFHLTTTNPGIIPLDIIYNVSGALWTPYYNIAVESGFDDVIEQNVSFIYQAIIRNLTADAWTDVDISLQRASIAIEPSTRRSILRQFIVDGKHSIDSDSQKKVTISHRVGPTTAFKWTYVVTSNPEVRMKVVIKNSTQNPLYAGDAELYVDGNFSHIFTVMEAQIEDSFEINLGIDPTIQLTKQVLKSGDLNNFTQNIVIYNSRKKFSVGPIEVYAPSTTNDTVLVSFPSTLSEGVKKYDYKQRKQILENVPRDCHVTVGWTQGSSGGYNWVCHVAPQATLEL